MPEIQWRGYFGLAQTNIVEDYYGCPASPVTPEVPSSILGCLELSTSVFLFQKSFFAWDSISGSDNERNTPTM